MLVGEAEIARRHEELIEIERRVTPESQTPWQEIQRSLVGQFATSAILEGSEKYQRIAQTHGLPRDSH